MYVRMTYANPERLREAVYEGLRVVERIPGHATRPARPWEVNTWFEPYELLPSRVIAPVESLYERRDGELHPLTVDFT